MADVEAVEQHPNAAAARRMAWTAQRRAAWLGQMYRVDRHPESLGDRFCQRQFRRRHSKPQTTV